VKNLFYGVRLGESRVNTYEEADFCNRFDGLTIRVGSEGTIESPVQ